MRHAAATMMFKQFVDRETKRIYVQRGGNHAPQSLLLDAGHFRFFLVRKPDGSDDFVAEALPVFSGDSMPAATCAPLPSMRST